MCLWLTLPKGSFCCFVCLFPRRVICDPLSLGLFHSSALISLLSPLPPMLYHLSSLPNNILYVFLILVHLNLENFPLDSFDEYAFKNYLFFSNDSAILILRYRVRDSCTLSACEWLGITDHAQGYRIYFFRSCFISSVVLRKIPFVRGCASAHTP